MPTVVSNSTVDDAGLAALSKPRRGMVVEREDGPGRYVSVGGPMDPWVRTLEVQPDQGGRHRVSERIDFHLAVPVWGVLFVLPIRRYLRRLHRQLAEGAVSGEWLDDEHPGSEASAGGDSPTQRTRQPWWAPPDRLDPRSATVLGLLCTLAVVAGYLGTLMTQTITYASSEFHKDTTAQSGTLAAVRIGVFLALWLVVLADRRGRRRLLLVAIVGSCVTAALGALAPGLVVLGATQTVSRGFSTAAVVLLPVVAAEEMPAGSRAFAASVLTLTAALGAGVCVWLLPLTAVGDGGWRILYLVPLLGIPLTVWATRRLPESRRFETMRGSSDGGSNRAGKGEGAGGEVIAEEGEEPHFAGLRGHGRRLALLGVALFCTALYAAPASQLQNEFLRSERGFSAAAISAFTLLTSTPAGIGVVVGGRLADTHGRRRIAAVGVVGGATLATVAFWVHGPPMWFAALGGTMLAALAVPALGVYGPELFPTAARGKANGVLQVLSVAGSSVGLLVAGLLDDRLGELAPGMTILAAGPLLVGILVLVAYPETAWRELEDINPEDTVEAAPGVDGRRETDTLDPP
jgi:MFS family permease